MSASLGGLATAQAMFGATAAIAAGTGPGPAGDAAGGAAGGSLAGSGVDVAVLKMALDIERHTVDILA